MVTKQEMMPLAKVSRQGAASVTALTPSFTLGQRVRNAWLAINGRETQDGYFGPGTPPQNNAPPDVMGRQFDYPFSINTTGQPKQSEGINYQTLRNLADSLDVARIVIETVKDQVCKIDWHITKRDSKGAEAADDPVAKGLEDFFRSPDAEHTWVDWLKMLLEDILVVDALCLYPELNADGTVASLEPVDPATIKRIINDDGRTPGEGQAAYQQFLKGTAANTYTRDELFFKVRNVRTNKIYGFSAIEQIVFTINTALQRNLSVLSYYTAGSTPDLIMATPKEWTMEQITEFKTMWDALLAGNTGQKRGTMFVPEGMKPIETKDKLLTDKFDEWVARVICSAFRVSPTPYISTFNRATAESAAESAKEDGVGSVLQYVKLFIDQILNKIFKQPDYVFAWKEEDETDPETKAKVNDIKIKNASKSINEARAEDGLKPIPGGEQYFFVTASGVIRLEDAVKGAPSAVAPAVAQAAGQEIAQNDAGKGDALSAKKGWALAKLAPNKSSVVVLSGAIKVAFYTLLQSVIKQTGKLLKATDPAASIEIELTGIKDVLEQEIASAGLDGWQQTWAAEKAVLPTFKNTEAVKYAAERAGELIDDELLADNTRDMIRKTIVDAIENGLTEDDLASELASNYAFSDVRAEAIANFEIGTATVMGQIDAYEKIGLRGKSWLLAPSEGTCPVCIGNADEGIIPLRQKFISGHMGPLAHPNCACDLLGHPTLEN